jgi:arabinosaccharide transport system substrate-binding protein
LLVLGASIGLLAWPIPARDGKTMWLSAPPHFRMYEPMVKEWNATHSDHYRLVLLSQTALERRMLSTFTSGTPAADLLEVERKPAARAFMGPLDGVGFVDLTDRLKAEGLLESLNGPSFTPWTTRGRNFGLPHDVHPVMLGYRADIVEAAGIDLSKVETWEDYFRVMRPLLRGPGSGDERYLLNLWETHGDHIELLFLQAGGGFFDAADRPIIANEINAHVLATITSWCVGPDRVCGDAPNFMASGNKLKVDGYVLASFMPDWMCGIWRGEMPQLAGKVKLMPLPAWEKGGRRTSVWGGSMIGIAKSAVKSPEDFEKSWAFAKELYLSPKLARTLYEAGDIVTPVKSNWSDPIFDRPDAYFSGQAKGRMYIDLAPQVPARSSSPYNTLAWYRVSDAASAIASWAREHQKYRYEEILPEARKVLGEAQRQVAAQMERNVFMSSTIREGIAQ